VQTYQTALSMMASARTERAFLMAAELFRDIPEALNADALAQECLEQAEMMKTQRRYDGALLDMNSDDPVRVEGAMQVFRSIGTFRDALAKADECVVLLQTAKEHEAERLRAAQDKKCREDRQQQRRAVRRRWFGKTALWLMLLAAVAAVIGQVRMYAASNIQITLTPDEEQFLTEGYRDYEFRYDAVLENRGWLDVASVEGAVVMELDNTVIVDTTVRFYNGGAPVVRAGKSSHYTWELSVRSEDAARILYETPFEDLDTHVRITRMVYTNGTVKTYS